MIYNIDFHDACTYIVTRILDSKRNECFIVIAENMSGDKLNQFGRKLMLSPNDVNEICSSNRPRFDKCIKLLDAWYQKLGSKAKLDDLLTILQKCSRSDISQKLEEIAASSSQ